MNNQAIIKQRIKPLRAKQAPAAQQQGFVLILALVLLGVMTLIGVSSMNSTNVELKATSNARQHHLAFNAVQSVLSFSISGDTNLDMQDIANQIVVMPGTIPGVTSLTGNMVQAGCLVGVGSSLEEGRGFYYNYFSVTADGFNQTSAGLQGLATSTQVQGIRYPAAACDI